jgi:polyisoprenoid-binding protein YceI
MKKIILSIVLWQFAVFTFSQTWVSYPAHSRLGFTISNFVVSHVTGNFKQFDVKVITTKPDYSDAIINVTARIESINTGIVKRDTHLKSDAFFDAQKYQTLVFKSTSLKNVNGNEYKLSGNLTMHGITKPVVLEVVWKNKNQSNKKESAVFIIKGHLNRSDFDIGKKYPGASIGNEVTINAFVELNPTK